MAWINLRWYGGLTKPALSPPAPLALAVSALLTVTTAWGFARVLSRPDYLPDRPVAIRLILVALAVDALWAWLFFAGRHPSVALGAAGALAVTAALATRRSFVVDARAGLLLLPWLAATVFVFLLDLSITLRNG